MGARQAAIANNRGWSLMLRGRWSDAATAFATALVLDPQVAHGAANLELLLAIAAIEDAWRLRISNLIALGVAASGIAAMAWTGLGWKAWQPLLMAVAILAVGTPMFAAGWIGGGDIKLLAANLLWFTFDGGWKMIVAVAVAGGLLTMLTLILRFFRRSGPDEKIAILRRGIGVPYGIAVAAGVAATILWARQEKWCRLGDSNT